MKKMMTMLVAAAYAAMLHGGDAERLEELELICAAEPSDDPFHSQQRRDNLARLRPPGLTGKRAELYDASQRDAAMED